MKTSGPPTISGTWKHPQTANRLPYCGTAKPAKQCPHYASSLLLLDERHRRLPWHDVDMRKPLIK
jgi:hypothetical protein